MSTIDEAAVAAAWDENAGHWIAQVRAGRDLYREVFNNPLFLAFLPALAGRAVLDLGCGEGTNTRLLARRGARMTGIDLSAGMIAAARAAEAAEPLGIAYRESSFTSLAGIADASFDLVVSTMALMDGPDFAVAAREARRVLRPGGGLYFSVTHPCFVTPLARWLRGADGSEEAFVVGEYFSDRAYVEEWHFKHADKAEWPPFAVPRFPYRLEDYVNGLCEAGLRIARILEPRPTEEMVAAHPWLTRLRRHVPIYLYLAAAKE